jgi:CelD/BcsL family acetyltransferase involved in cellulose biosynthesis
MTIAAAIERQGARPQTHTDAIGVASIEIVGDMRAAEATWRKVEIGDHLLTPFQRFDFLAAWQEHVGAGERFTPFIVIAYDAQRRPLLLLPLGTRQEHGVCVARFLGGKHATFNMPIWRRDFARGATAADIDALLAMIHAQSNVDILALMRQPQRWHDCANPMLLKPGQPSANVCPLMLLVPGAAPAERISNSFRRRLKGKERKLQAVAGYRYYRATEDSDVARLLDAFFIIKPQRMAQQKLPNVFADPGVESFIRTACMTRTANGNRVIDIHALECDEEVIAIYAGVADDHRFSMMFNTYTLSGNAKHSPGLILMRDIVDHYAERGFTSIDLGIGSDEYKRLFCKADEPIFDSFIPLSPRGHVAAAGLSAMTYLKRMVKQTPMLKRAAQKLRSSVKG